MIAVRACAMDRRSTWPTLPMASPLHRCSAPAYRIEKYSNFLAAGGNQPASCGLNCIKVQSKRYEGGTRAGGKMPDQERHFGRSSI